MEFNRPIFRQLSGVFIIIFLFQFSSAMADGLPLKLKIDTENLSEEESKKLILGNEKPLMATFEKVKLNGQELKPYVLSHGSSIYLRTEDSLKERDSKEMTDHKVKENLKTVVNCDVKGDRSLPKGMEIQRDISLHEGQAVFLLTYDDEYKVNGSYVNLYLCPWS